MSFKEKRAVAEFQRRGFTEHLHLHSAVLHRQSLGAQSRLNADLRCTLGSYASRQTAGTSLKALPCVVSI